MSDIPFVVHSGVNNMIVGNGASSFIAIVDVVGGDVAAWGYVTESVGVRAGAVGMIAVATECTEIWGRGKVIGGVPIVSVPGAFLLVFSREVVHLDGFSHGKEFGAIGGWSWNRFFLSKIGVNAGPDLGANETVADGERPGAPFGKLSFQFSSSLQEVFVI
jgi:hypothetical protein